MFVSVIAFITVTITFVTICHATNQTNPCFPAILIFGDSTVDSGNNNHLNTPIRANFFPYGKDFPGGVATGRFSNGKIIPDFVASYFGIKDTVPPFLDPSLSDADIITGVSFASSGSGLDVITNSVSGAISIVKQTEFFGRYVERLQEIVGEEKAAEIIGEAVVVIGAANNDFILNFYDLPSRHLEFSVEGYQNFILIRLQDIIQKLYGMGCRIIAVGGLPPIGCLPIQMTTAVQLPNERQCIEEQNTNSKAYNKKLEKLLMEMQANLTGSFMFYADIYKPMLDMMMNPQYYGLKETKRGCCGTGTFESSFMCNKFVRTCSNPNEFMFWDDIHPTQVVYRFIGELLAKEILKQMSELSYSKP